MDNKFLFSLRTPLSGFAATLPSRRSANEITITLSNGESMTVRPTLVESCVKAIDTYVGMGYLSTEQGGIGSLRTADEYIVEHHLKTDNNNDDDNKIAMARWNKSTGEILACIYTPATCTIEPYCVKSSGQDGSILLLAMIPVLRAANKQFDHYMQDYIIAASSGYANASELLFYTAEILKQEVIAGTLPLELTAGGNVGRITSSRISSGQITPVKTLIGKFIILDDDAVDASSGSARERITGSSFRGKYSLGATLSEQEYAMIPQLDDSYVLPQEVVDACEHIKKSTGRRNPVRNLLLRGPAGTGKTTMAKAIASGLNLPYCKLTCNANTEIFDLLGQLFPDSHNEDEQKLPDMSFFEKDNIEEILYDPEAAYRHITGTEKASATLSDCFVALYKQLLSSSNAKQSSGGQTYSYIESDLIRAMRYGWVVEIQEPSVITQPSVLVGLNSLLEKDGSITLANGEVIHRHPNCVVVMTTNVAYEGCRDLNQSVIDRCQLIMQIEDLSAETMVDRAMAATGCDDDDLVRRMVEVVQNADEFLQQRCITDGVVGMRGLLDWIESTQITDDPYKSALMTIINRATSDADDRAALIEAALEPVFSARN